MRREVYVQVYPDTPKQRVLLPETLTEYAELWRAIDAHRTAGQYETWKAAMRLWSAADLYFLTVFVMSAGRSAKNRWRGGLHFFHESQLDIARAVQFAKKEIVLIASRGIGKSTIANHADQIHRKLQDANHSSMIFSATRELAQKHLRAIQAELTSNRVLLEVWDDRFFADPDHEAPTWSLKDGLVIKRGSSRPEASFSCEAFVSRLPVGLHPDRKVYDDIEEETAVATEDAMANLEEKYVSSTNLKSANNDPDIIIGTYYHPQGLLVKLGTRWGKHVVIFAGENLAVKAPSETAGPMGGTPACGYTREQLFYEVNLKGGVKSDRAMRDYGRQIACDPLAGEASRLDVTKVHYYTDDAAELCRRMRMNLVVCADCSRGLGDPTSVFVWGLTPSKRLYWLDGLRGRFPRRQRHEAIYNLLRRWWDISHKRIHQLRVEEVGQAEYVDQQREYHERASFEFPSHAIIGVQDNRQRKMDRAYDRWEPLLTDGALWFPETMFRPDESGDLVDLVGYFISNELGLFPKPSSDDMLDAGGLIGEPTDKVGFLPWPAARIDFWDEDVRPGGRNDGGYAADFNDDYASAGVL